MRCGIDASYKPASVKEIDASQRVPAMVPKAYDELGVMGVASAVI